MTFLLEDSFLWMPLEKTNCKLRALKKQSVHYMIILIKPKHNQSILKKKNESILSDKNFNDFQKE